MTPESPIATSTPQAPPATATHDELVASAKRLAPMLRERVEETEARRNLAPETVEEIRRAGIPRSMTPTRWGGYELGFDTAVATTVELAKGCASTAWCTMFISTHQWGVCHFDEQAQAEVLGADPDARVAAMLAPLGTARRVDGGYRLTGAWPWSSLVGHSAWFMAGSFVEGDQPPHLHAFLLDSSQFSWKDTWFSSGMRGTGSHTTVVEEAFVPAHRVIGFERLSEGTGAGVESNPAPFMRAQFGVHAGTVMAAAALGAARGAHEDFCEWISDRTSTNTGSSVAERASTQAGLATAAAEIDAAEMLLQRTLDYTSRPYTVDYGIRVQCRRDHNIAMQLLVAAIDRLMAVAGAPAMVDGDPLQRAWRDIHTISGHALFKFDGVSERYARFVLGLEPPPDQRDPYY